jgi:rSAM-associated Gly-rich repeat protein
MGKAAVNGSGAVMDKLSRRSLLRVLAGGALSTAGTVILARTSFAALGTPEVTKPAGLDGQALDVQARAAELDAGGLGPAGETHAQFLNFPGVGFGNGFRNGGFGNGGFRNGGFRNGGFRNGGFRNGGRFRNGGFRNW